MSDRMIAIISLVVAISSLALNIYQAKKNNRYKREALYGQKITNNNDAVYKTQKLSQQSSVIDKLNEIEIAVIKIYKLLKGSNNASRR